MQKDEKRAGANEQTTKKSSDLNLNTVVKNDFVRIDKIKVRIKFR